MTLTNKTFSPYHLKVNNSLNIGFIISVFLCSKIVSIERQIIYIFYIGNVIPHDLIKYESETITKDYLLQLIFKLSSNKKIISKIILRAITGLEDKSTFNKYFNTHLNDLGFSKKRGFTLEETLEILKFWQGDDKWGRMEAFSKGELANRFMNGNYEELELLMTDDIIAYENYTHHDFIKPIEFKKFIHKVSNENSNRLIYEEEKYNAEYLLFFFLLYVLDAYKVNQQNISN